MQHKTLIKALSILLLPVLVAGLLLAVAPTAHADIITVCAGSCDYTTIQAAVNAAASSDTIVVSAGTYTEQINLNKQVTIEGANAAIAAGATPGTRVAETIINGGFYVTASGAKIDGVTIQNGYVSGSVNVGVAVGASSVTVEDTIIENVSTPAQSDGLSTQVGINNLTLTNSTIRNNWRGIYLNPGSGHVLTGNLIASAVLGSGSGVGIGSDGLSNTTLTGNTITGFVEGWGASAVGTGVVATNNTFTGNTISVAHYGGNTINAANNYWGTVAPAGVMASVSGSVTYAPWCNSTFTSCTFVLPVHNITLNTDHPTIQSAIDAASANNVIQVDAGSYTENVNVNKALSLRGSVGGGFSAPVAIGPTAAPGVWYTDRYAPGVFESYNFGGEMVLRHGVRIADSASNRPGSYSSAFYNTQGRKLDTNLAGSQQSMSIDLWLDSTMAGPDGRIAGLWATGVDSVDVVSSYPILAFRNRDQISGFPTVTPGFYGWDFNGSGGYILLKATTAADYNKWHTLSFVWTVGTGAQYFLDGEPMLAIADVPTIKLANVILQVYNFGQDYDVYWDNFKVGSTTPAAFESVVTGLMTISASNVEVTGFYLTNPGQAYSVLASGALSNIEIANNRIQDVGGPSTTDQIKGVYMPNGPDNVTISNNVFSKIVASSTKSADAINFGDSNTTNPNTGVVIQANNISNITAGRGAYGVKLNNGAGAPGAEVKNNTFSGLSGLWTHAIGLEGPTPNAVVTGNWFDDITAAGADKAAVFFEKNPNGATVLVTGNRFNGGGYYGAAIHPDDAPGGANNLCYVVNAENNWWNSPLGPTGPGASLAGPGVDYSPWWTDAAGTGTASASPGSVVQFVVPAGATTAQQQAIINCAVGATVTYLGNPLAGGVVVNSTGVTIDLNGVTVGPGSPAFTINADDVTINGPGALDGNGSTTDPGILVNAGADNFILDGVEVREWANGVHVDGAVDLDIESLKIVNNWIHSNTGAGLLVDKQVAGVVTIEGNLFKVNGVGVSYDGAGTLDAEYNSWGADTGPTGLGANVDYDPWTFAEVYLDVDPTTVDDQITRNVSESTTTTSFGVNLNVDGKNLYGVSFVFSYNATLLTPGAVSFDPQWASLCAPLTGLPTNAIGYRCTRTSGPAWDGGTVATFDFTANSGALTGDGPWTAVFDISALPADTSAGSQGGVKVFVNNAGYGAASIVPDRDITDANDGQVTIVGIAQFTGFVDLQGRPNDSGALVEAKQGSDVKANATSASSGKYTTSYVGAFLLAIGGSYDVTVDRALYLPATRTWTLTTRPLTTLTTVILLGGDADNNDVIGIDDATCIGGAYGWPPAVCGTGGSSDVNGDGGTNILDLVLFGGNYGLSVSPWTP